MGEFSRRYGHLALCGLLSVVGCAGPSAEKSGGGSGKLPPQVLDTSDVAELIATLPGSSPRCQGGLCQCREIDASGRGNAETDAESAPPAPGFKRFELRTGRGDDTMRITIEGVGTFVKSGANPEARCIYVDLPAGAHRVRYHITAAHPTVAPLLLYIASELPASDEPRVIVYQSAPMARSRVPRIWRGTSSIGWPSRPTESSIRADRPRCKGCAFRPTARPMQPWATSTYSWCSTPTSSRRALRPIRQTARV